MKRLFLIFCIVILCSNLSYAGMIVAWGDNTYGQCDVPLSDSIVAVAGGNRHSIGVTPEPSTLLLLGLGAFILRRKR